MRNQTAGLHVTMNKLILPVLVISICGFLASVNGEKNKTLSNNEVAEVPPVEATVLIDLENEELVKKDTKLDENARARCKHTDYRSYVKCLLEDSKREKRQGYSQQCSGASCNLQPIYSQQCSGNNCVQTNQQPCSANGCVFVANNCGGNGCVQVGQTCNGIGCVPATPCHSPPCPSPALPQDTRNYDDILKGITEIKAQFGQLRTLNQKLVDNTDRTNSYILRLFERPSPTSAPPVLLGHNTTTNIDINNYLNNTNVINLPTTKNEPVPENDDRSKTQCCTVLRPKTCRRTLRYNLNFFCHHKTHRTCGSHCAGHPVVYSRVRPGCKRDDEEDCVSYHPVPRHPQHYPSYPIFGHYPPYYPPMYYPNYGPVHVPNYPPPPYPFYPVIDELGDDVDCEGCESEVGAEECEDGSAECNRSPSRGDRVTGSRLSRGIPLNEIPQVRKEARAINRPEDQLTASLDRLWGTAELEKVDGKESKITKTEVKSITKSKTVDESAAESLT